MNYVRIQEGIELPSISGYKPFKAVIVVEETVSENWQSSVSDWIVESGCYYMMAWGMHCSSWDTSVDLANIAQYEDNIPDDGFVTTTWHEDEPLSEVFWFSKNTAFSEYHDSNEVLVVHISKVDKCDEFTRKYKNA
ncbi:DUF7684 family protein [Aliikangiella sp. IMCC44632]